LDDGGPYAADYATMLEDERGSYYAKDEADAFIAKLEAASLEMTKAARHLMQQRDDAWAEVARLKDERDGVVEALRFCKEALGEFATDQCPEGWRAIEAYQKAERALAAVKEKGRG
jgi:uncharacterized coiled-coil DUF342 family protein